MNQTQKFYDSYDKNNIVLKLTNSYYHNKNLALIRNRKNPFKEPLKSIHKRKIDPMYKFRVEKDNEELCEKIKDISNRKAKQYDNSFFNSYRTKLAIFKDKRRKELQEEIDKENDELYKRMGITKPFINTKKLDDDFSSEHQIIVKKLRKVNENGTVVLPKIYNNPMINKRVSKTEENKNDEMNYQENTQIDDDKHKSKDVEVNAQEPEEIA
jgi:hypothetical protein